MTELDAVNLVLEALGESPVASTDLRHPTVALALRHIRRLQEALLAESWYFNTVKATLTPDVNSKIVLPASYLSVSKISPLSAWATQLPIRSGYLLNIDTNSLVWGGPIVVSAKLDLSFSDLPVAAQQAIAYRAAYTAYASDVGDAGAAIWGQLAQESYANLSAENARQLRHNTKSTAAWGKYRESLRG